LAGLFSQAGLKKAWDEVQKGADVKLLEGLKAAGVPEKEVRAINLKGLVFDGLGEEFALHVYDSAALLDVDFARFAARLTAATPESAVFAAAALQFGALPSPVYLSAPVRDAKVVDASLEAIDRALARVMRGDWGGLVAPEFYRARLPTGETMRTAAF